jgi:hypothetical protein
MPLTLNCTCGKTLRPKDEAAGKRVKCPACGAVVAVPKSDEFDDFEVVEDEPAATTPTPNPPAKKAVVKADVVEEPVSKPTAAPAAAPTAPEPENPFAKLNTKKKKKKKKKKAEAEGDDDSVEKVLEAQARLARTVRGVSYLVVGILIVIGVAYIYFAHWEDVLSTGGKSVLGVICMGVLGVVAIGKGLIGLALGQFLGDDD